MVAHQSGKSLRPAAFSGVPSYYEDMARAAILAMRKPTEARGFRKIRRYIGAAFLWFSEYALEMRRRERLRAWGLEPPSGFGGFKE